MLKWLSLLLFVAGIHAQEKKNEIGREDGLRYSHLFNKISLGLRISPDYTYSEGEVDPNISNTYPTSYSSTSYSNHERREIFVGLQGSLIYKYFDMMTFEPFSEIGYLFYFTESHSNTTAPSYFDGDYYITMEAKTLRHVELVQRNLFVIPFLNPVTF